ncbi:hypothetical protein ACUXG4_003204 [Cupriavidus metallidurans]
MWKSMQLCSRRLGARQVFRVNGSANLVGQRLLPGTQADFV